MFTQFGGKESEHGKWSCSARLPRSLMSRAGIKILLRVSLCFYVQSLLWMGVLY